MFQSLVVYTILLIIIVLSFYLTTFRKNNIQLINDEIKTKSFWQPEILFVIITFSVFYGIRYDVGYDYLNYLDSYLRNEPVSRGEFLFEIIRSFFNYLDLHFVFYFSAIAFLQFVFFFYGFRDYRFLFPLLAFFLLTNGAFHSWMNIMRQSLAFCIWVFSLKFIEKQQFWKYIFWVTLAYLFHTSAAILLIFYPILRSKKFFFKSVLPQVIIFFSAFIVNMIFNSIAQDFQKIIDLYVGLLGETKYESYNNISILLERVSERSGTGFARLYKILINLIIIFYSVRMKDYYRSTWFNMMYFFYFLGVILYYIFPVGLIDIMRPFTYFYYFDSIMFAYFGYYLLKNKSTLNTLLFIQLIIGFLGIYILSLVMANPNDHIWYQFYFQK